MSSIFLSHSHKDKSFSKKLANDLSKLEIRVWLDEAEINIGDSLIEKISSGIDEMEYVGAILSKHSVSSEWVKKELDIAMNQEIKNRRVKVLPILIEDCQLPTFLEGKLFADFREERNYSDQLNKLIKAILYEKSPISAHPIEEPKEAPASAKPNEEPGDNYVSDLSQIVFPPITLNYCLRVFFNYISKTFKLKLPRFKYDAQIIICNQDGVIKRHPHLSSLGHNARLHEGVVLWSSYEEQSGDRPFDILFNHKRQNGFVVLADSGYSQYYAPISSRNNSRICIVYTRWHRKRVYVLEMHHELSDRIEEKRLAELGTILGRRMQTVLNNFTEHVASAYG